MPDRAVIVVDYDEENAELLNRLLKKSAT